MHVVVIPNMMTPESLKELYKLVDIVISVPARLCWVQEKFESLMIAIVFYFLTHSPWELRGTAKMFAVARKIITVFQTTDLNIENSLSKFLFEVRRLPSFSVDVVRFILYFKQKLIYHVKTIQESLQEGGEDPNQRERLILARG